MTEPPDDPWDFAPRPASGAQATTPLTLRVHTTQQVTPLDPAGDAPLPDPLDGLLFGPVGDAGTVPQTFAILDAAKITNLPQMLEGSALPHLCLFKGKALEDMGDAAPWIVELAKDTRFTRALLTRSDAPWHLWDNEGGVFLRSRTSLEGLCTHFRKFTKVRDEDGNWLFFRFWEPTWTQRLAEVLTPAQLAKLLGPVDGFLAITSGTCTALYPPRAPDAPAPAGQSAGSVGS